MKTEEMVLSSCCGKVLIEEKTWLISPTGRREIGTVVVCPEEKCKRPAKGDVRRGALCPKEFNGTSWALMLDCHPWPPYYFMLRNGIAVPQDQRI